MQALDAPLKGALEWVMSDAHRVALWHAGPRTGPKALLLVHSINAAASAYEIRPLFEHYSRERRVYALELPGFGHADKPDILYTVEHMVRAIGAAVAHLGTLGISKIDVLGLSLSCEYLAAAALQHGTAFRSLGFISPTGFESASPIKLKRGAGGSAWLRRILNARLWSGALFRVLMRPWVIRAFLRKTWGSPQIDEGLWTYDCALAKQPGAEHAPYSFIAGYLFTADALALYEALSLPVLVVYGSRGDFVDYGHIDRVRPRANWHIEQFATGAFPHFEALADLTHVYDRFLSSCDAVDA